MQFDDSKYGSRNKRGDWKPYKLSTNIPFFDWPFSLTKNLKWLLGIPGYIVPWTFFYGLIAVILWVYFTPSIETLKNFNFDKVFIFNSSCNFSILLAFDKRLVCPA